MDLAGDAVPYYKDYQVMLSYGGWMLSYHDIYLEQCHPWCDCFLLLLDYVCCHRDCQQVQVGKLIYVDRVANDPSLFTKTEKAPTRAFF